MKGRAQRMMLAALFTAVTLLLGVSTALAQLRVNVMPSGVITKVNTWDSGPYTWPGNALELWGNVDYDGNQPLTYTWNFGAGEGTSNGTVTNRSNIASTHTYASVGSFIATLTVSDGTQSDTDSVYIDVVPKSLSVETNLNVQRGLKYLYMSRQDWTVNGCNTYYWNGDRWEGSTGLAVLAFEDHGHREMNDHNKDIYAETVQKGLQSVFAMLRSTPASNVVNADSDLNGNGLKVYEGYTGGTMYEQGILSMAIANTATPDAVATCGTDGTITGKTYRTLLEDMVDYTAFAQEERTNWGGQGGWRYTANYGSSDNSVSQWPALGLAAAASAPWNINDSNPAYPAYPKWVKSSMQTWLRNSQCKSNGYWSGSNYTSSGGFGYDWSCSWPNIAKTGSGISATTFAGGGGDIPSALAFIAQQWPTTSYDYGNKGDHYAMYAVKKGLQYTGISTVGGHDWQQEYNQWYVSNKIDNGTYGYYWPGSVRVNGAQTTTAFALLVMAPGLVDLPPVANAGIDQEVKPGVDVTFNGTASKHSDPARNIARYEWDFDYDGVTFTADAFGSTASKVGGYALPAGVGTKNFTVALKVYDDSTPVAKTGIDTAIVTVTNGNVAPVADPGGPYFGAVGDSITLDGSKSYDANACPKDPAKPSCLGDAIVNYQWDLNGNGIYGAADGEPEGTNPKQVVNFGSFVGTKTIGLKVTDSFGRSAIQSTQATTAAFSDLAPVNYLNTQRTPKLTLPRKWNIGWKVFIRNGGNGAASNVKASLTNVPAGVTVTKATVVWSGKLEAGETQLSDDAFTYTAAADIDMSKATWDIEFTDQDGVTKHVIRGVPQGVLLPVTKPHLIKTDWSQRPPYTHSYDSDHNGTDEEYLPGCGAVAVGQLINYYFSTDNFFGKSYRQGWLEELLRNVTVYPQFNTLTSIGSQVAMTWPAYTTKGSYTNADASDIKEFLWYVALGLDSTFNQVKWEDDGSVSCNSGGTGSGGVYSTSLTDILRNLNQDKLKNLLIDRFRFRNDITVPAVAKLDLEKEFIIKSIDEGNPILVVAKNSNDLVKDGHAFIIDGYKYENNIFTVYLNLGWGTRDETAYATSGAITLVSKCGAKSYNEFHLYKGTRPINF
jgi:hypothetical protein